MDVPVGEVGIYGVFGIFSRMCGIEPRGSRSLGFRSFRLLELDGLFGAWFVQWVSGFPGFRVRVGRAQGREVLGVIVSGGFAIFWFSVLIGRFGVGNIWISGFSGFQVCSARAWGEVLGVFGGLRRGAFRYFGFGVLMMIVIVWKEYWISRGFSGVWA